MVRTSHVCPQCASFPIQSCGSVDPLAAIHTRDLRPHSLRLLFIPPYSPSTYRFPPLPLSLFSLAVFFSALSLFPRGDTPTVVLPCLSPRSLGQSTATATATTARTPRKDLSPDIALPLHTTKHVPPLARARLLLVRAEARQEPVPGLAAAVVQSLLTTRAAISALSWPPLLMARAC